MQLDALPVELREHIDDIATDWFAELAPVRPGASNNPCFLHNEELRCDILTMPRTLKDPALFPSELRKVYSKYESGVEFVDQAKGWIFMSEEEISTRVKSRREAGQHRMVDIAFCSAGMGHVRVLAYDPVSDRVYEDMDGGSNGIEREINIERRNKDQIEHRKDTLPFVDWWNGRLPPRGP